MAIPISGGGRRVFVFVCVLCFFCSVLFVDTWSPDEKKDCKG